MLPDKVIKEQFKEVTSKDPDKYYATEILKKEEFIRKQCEKCNIFFWTTHKERKICGDSSCEGGFDVISTPAKNKLTYIEVWQKLAEYFQSLNYKKVNRYPVVARWNPTADFTMASISAFQPYVVSGEVEAPAKKLVIPQFCLRFVDIDNVGITGSHCTGFVMIGQHAFVSPEEWNQNEFFSDIYNYITKIVGVPKEELTLHEDAWAGGGNYGCCMEFFSRGVELFNQVYIMYEQTPEGPKELNIKVLDMGLGMERIAWFSQGTPNIYEAIFPETLKKLKSITNIEMDLELFKKFSKYSGTLNIDEVDDINKAWENVANKLDLEVAELKSAIEPMTALYSIAEHARALLVSIADGALPSNTGGSYNLRVLLRRALSFIDKFNLNVKLSEVAEWHANELEPLFPELKKNLETVKKVLDFETERYQQTKEKAKALVQKIIEKNQVSEDMLLELYDSNGISPEIVKAEAAKLNKPITIPENFYKRVAELHEKREQVHSTKKDHSLDIDSIQETEALYFDDYSKTDFKTKVLKIIDNKVILDKTLFYPTSGGQLHDTGTLNDQEVTEVFKQGPTIIHVLKDKPNFKENEEVEGKVNFEDRKQLTQHHTAAHIINAAARTVLGNHINQAGAKKTLEKAHLDITHYKSVTDEEIKQIEIEANKIIEEAISLDAKFLSRAKAEEEYGMNIYQGGAIPGKELRIVNIPGRDVEACAGTHLHSTKEVEQITITKATKIQDGVVRLEFKAGDAAKSEINRTGSIVEELKLALNCEENQIPGRAEELFGLWKRIVKKKKEVSFKLTSTNAFEGDIIVETCRILRTQPEHLVKTVKRFKTEIEEKLN
jgi:alanyl-tRNA synthetase